MKGLLTFALASSFVLVAFEANGTAPARSRPVPPDFRSAGEVRIRQELLHPRAAKFKWPFDLRRGFFRPEGSTKRYSGWVTCASVNTDKTRVSRSLHPIPFVIVFDQGQVAYAELDNAWGTIERACKSLSLRRSARGNPA